MLNSQPVKFLNFSTFQLKLCPGLQEAGVQEVSKERRNLIDKYTRFKGRIATTQRIKENAENLAVLAASSGATHVLLNCYPFMISYVERAMNDSGVNVVYADSVRTKGQELYKLKTLVPAMNSSLPAHLTEGND